MDVAKLFAAAGPKIASIAVGDHEKIETEIEWKGGSSFPPAIVTAGDRFRIPANRDLQYFSKLAKCFGGSQRKNEFTVACALLVPLDA